ncbi:MAG TPA: hypothetical protein VE944_22495 [Nostoc sp.]|nr:hypothetical protein [Nostoc sp.]HYX17067.1 hypothetical protein [Nostoc sp.]
MRSPLPYKMRVGCGQGDRTHGKAAQVTHAVEATIQETGAWTWRRRK